MNADTIRNTFSGIEIDVPASSSHVDHLEAFNNEEIVIARYRTGVWAMGVLTDGGYFVPHDVSPRDVFVRQTAYDVIVKGKPMPPMVD